MSLINLLDFNNDSVEDSNNGDNSNINKSDRMLELERIFANASQIPQYSNTTKDEGKNDSSNLLVLNNTNEQNEDEQSLNCSSNKSLLSSRNNHDLIHTLKTMYKNIQEKPSFSTLEKVEMNKLLDLMKNEISKKQVSKNSDNDGSKQKYGGLNISKKYKDQKHKNAIKRAEADKMVL